MPRKFIFWLVLVSFICNMALPYGVNAQTLNLPALNQLLNVSQNYSFPVLRGLKLDPKNPLNIEFIIDPGTQKTVNKEEAGLLIKYFLAALTIPRENLWVNLSPYESNRIIPGPLSQTELGEDMLGQDYLLKQLAASLTYPESATGKAYWNDLKNTQAFNKVWITADKAQIYEGKNVALITKSSLKALTEEDYLAQQNNNFVIASAAKQSQLKIATVGNSLPRNDAINAFKTNILPLINKDINEGKNFAQLRQIYHAVILGLWFKNKFKDSFYKAYLNKETVNGIDSADKTSKDKIYNLYVEAFKKGVYNYVKRESVGANNYSSVKRITKRQYFSGGVTPAAGLPPEGAQITADPAAARGISGQPLAVAIINLVPNAFTAGHKSDGDSLTGVAIPFGIGWVGDGERSEADPIIARQHKTTRALSRRGLLVDDFVEAVITAAQNDGLLNDSDHAGLYDLEDLAYGLHERTAGAKFIFDVFKRFMDGNFVSADNFPVFIRFMLDFRTRIVDDVERATTHYFSSDHMRFWDEKYIMSLLGGGFKAGAASASLVTLSYMACTCPELLASNFGKTFFLSSAAGGTLGVPLAVLAAWACNVVRGTFDALVYSHNEAADQKYFSAATEIKDVLDKFFTAVANGKEYAALDFAKMAKIVRSGDIRTVAERLRSYFKQRSQLYLDIHRIYDLKKTAANTDDIFLQFTERQKEYFDGLHLAWFRKYHSYLTPEQFLEIAYVHFGMEGGWRELNPEEAVSCPLERRITVNGRVANVVETEDGRLIVTTGTIQQNAAKILHLRRADIGFTDEQIRWLMDNGWAGMGDASGVGGFVRKVGAALKDFGSTRRKTFEERVANFMRIYEDWYDAKSEMKRPSQKLPKPSEPQFANIRFTEGEHDQAVEEQRRREAVHYQYTRELRVWEEDPINHNYGREMAEWKKKQDDLALRCTNIADELASQITALDQGYIAGLQQAWVKDHHVKLTNLQLVLHWYLHAKVSKGWHPLSDREIAKYSAAAGRRINFKGRQLKVFLVHTGQLAVTNCSDELIKKMYTELEKNNVFTHEQAKWLMDNGWVGLWDDLRWLFKDNGGDTGDVSWTDTFQPPKYRNEDARIRHEGEDPSGSAAVESRVYSGISSSSGGEIVEHPTLGMVDAGDSDYRGDIPEDTHKPAVVAPVTSDQIANSFSPDLLVAGFGGDRKDAHALASVLLLEGQKRQREKRKTGDGHGGKKTEDDVCREYNIALLKAIWRLQDWRDLGDAEISAILHTRSMPGWLHILTTEEMQKYNAHEGSMIKIDGRALIVHKIFTGQLAVTACKPEQIKAKLQYLWESHLFKDDQIFWLMNNGFVGLFAEDTRKHLAAMQAAMGREYNDVLTNNQLYAVLRVHYMPGGWRPLSSEEIETYRAVDGKKIIINGRGLTVHKVYTGELGVTTCTLEQIAAKRNYLKGVGFEDKQIKWLMDNGWVGEKKANTDSGDDQQPLVAGQPASAVGGLTWDNTKIEKFGNGDFYFENIPNLKDIKSMGFVIREIKARQTISQFLR